MLLLVLQSEDPRETLVDRLWKMDEAQFYGRADAFGASRIEAPKSIGRTHKVMDRMTKPPYIAERFLIGNITEPFTAKDFRTQYVPIGHRSDEPAKPTFKQSDLEKFFVQNFGKDKFDATLQSWRVRAYALKAEAACLTCHNWAKEGDALGYLVYAIGSKRATVE